MWTELVLCWMFHYALSIVKIIKVWGTLLYQHFEFPHVCLISGSWASSFLMRASTERGLCSSSNDPQRSPKKKNALVNQLWWPGIKPVTSWTQNKGFIAEVYVSLDSSHIGDILKVRLIGASFVFFMQQVTSGVSLSSYSRSLREHHSPHVAGPLWDIAVFI